MAGNSETAPSKTVAPETITPHKLTVAILVREYIQFRDSGDFKGETDNVLKANYRRDFCVLILKLLQSPDLNLKQLQDVLGSEQYHIHKNLIERFRNTLLLLYENGTGVMLDLIDLINFNENSITPSGDLLESNLISKSSIVGYFLRRLIVSFDKLTFSEVTNVYLTYRKYYEDWKKTQHCDVQIKANGLALVDDWSANKDQWSRRQAELFIATQAAFLTNNDGKALSPVELQNRITNLLKSNPTLAEAHYLSYLNYMRVGEFCEAIDSLYHCFDRSSLTDSKSSSEDKSRVYRFAALNLAVLHYNFGHKEEALASLKEAIRLSQAYNDNVCLQQALCWLYRLTPTNKDKLIERSVLKSFVLNLSYTASLGIQTFVKYACLVSGHPHQIFGTLTKSDVVNCQNNLKGLICNSYALKAALWQFYGKSEMCSLWSQLLFYLNIDNSDNKTYYGEGFCLAVCNLANYLLLQGKYNLVCALLNYAKEKFPNEPHSHVWMLCENLCIFTRALYHEDWRNAESAAQKILVINKWEGYLRMAELFYYKQDYGEARNFIDIITQQYKSDSKYKLKTHYYIRAKVLLAEIQFTTTYPERTPPGILTLLENCLIETKKYHLDYQSALIQLHIANIQLSLGMSRQALKVLDTCILQILAQGGCFDRARAMLLRVKCLIADQTNVADRKELLLKAVHMLETVKDDFRAVEAHSRTKDVLYLQAQLYHAIDMKEERNKCSMQFRLLEEETATKNNYTIIKYL